ncbi:MAG TPA: recombinase family protein, partial [Polyangiaceae bacterium]|nr:recombinase family protein [Polyangiaceae bacterium]
GRRGHTGLRGTCQPSRTPVSASADRAQRDRIARDVILASEVERAAARAGARLVSATGEGNGDSPADAFLRTVIDGAAQYERGLVRARTRAALAAKRARRERVGAVPYGFALKRDGVHLVAARSEQATIAQARELRAAGLSLRAVAATLASEGRVSRRGRRFLPAQIARMVAVRNKRVAGRAIRGFLTVRRRTRQIQVVRELGAHLS